MCVCLKGLRGGEEGGRGGKRGSQAEDVAALPTSFFVVVFKPRRLNGLGILRIYFFYKNRRFALTGGKKKTCKEMLPCDGV